MKQQVSERNLFLINFWLIVLSITALKFPIALGFRDDISYLFLGIIPLLSGILFNILHLLRRKESPTYSKLGIVVFTVFTLFWIVAMVRSVFFEFTFASIYILGHLVSWVILIVFVILAFINTPEDLRQKLKKALVYCLGLYIFLNLIFYFIGVDPQDTLYLAHYPSQMLSVLGIQSFRVLFPMASSINGFGTLAGLALSGLFFVFKSVRNWREKSIIGILLISCVMVILLTDSRGAFIFSIFSIVLVVLPRNLFNWFKWTPFLLSLFIPILFLMIPNSLAEKFNFLDRPATIWDSQESAVTGNQCELVNNGSGGFLTNRTIIWQFAFEELSQFKLIHIPGYGFRGQSISGLTDKYSCLFKSYENREFTTTHQVWLQTIIDLGYLGFLVTLLAFLWIVYKLSRHWARNTQDVEVSLLAVVLYIVSAGTLEATIYPDAFEIFCVISFVFISMIFPAPSADQEIKMKTLGRLS